MQPVTTTRVLRSSSPPAAASGTPPPPPPPFPSSPSRRAAPPPLRPPELPLPSALVPPKKRRVLRTPPKATTPPPPPPPPPPVVPAVAVPAPTPPPPPPQADHAESPLFSAPKPSPPPPPAEKPSSAPPPPPPAGKPPSPPPPPSAEKPPSPPPPPPAENPPSLPPSPPAENPSLPPPPPRVAENPSLPPRPPPPAQNPSSPPRPPAADEKPSAPSPTDAAAEPAPAPKARTRKVRTVIRRVPKGTIAARKAAAEASSAAAAGAAQPGKGHALDNSSRNAAVADELVHKEQSFGGNTTEKPGTTCNPTAVCEAQLGKGPAVCETQLGKGTVGGGILGSVQAMDIGGEHEVEKKLGSRGEDRAEVVMSERQRRRMTEVYVGGLNRDAKEEDVRAALSVAGEITEVRMIMDATIKKNKGYCFVRYRESAQARKAIAKFSNVKICGKKCRVEVLDGNDKIFLGNIDKKWKKEDIMKLLHKIGVENIDVVTLLADSNNPGYNRGFAFLELETYRDAQIAYRKLSRKDVFGKGLNIRVAWADPLNGPDENQMQKVKAVFVEGVPNSWDQAKLTEIFKEYGRVELVVLSRDMHRAKRNDFAVVHYTTHEAAILCLESFDGEKLTENGSKVNMRVSLAKSVQKGKNNMEDHKFCINQKYETKTARSERKLGLSSLHIFPSSSGVIPISGYTSTTHGFIQVLRELAPWRQERTGSGGLTKNYPRILSGEKRPFSALGIDSYSTSRIPHAGLERNTYATPTSSYSGSTPAITQYSPPYHHESRCLLDSDSVLSEPCGGIQMRQACSHNSGMS